MYRSGLGRSPVPDYEHARPARVPLKPFGSGCRATLAVSYRIRMVLLERRPEKNPAKRSAVPETGYDVERQRPPTVSKTTPSAVKGKAVPSTMIAARGLPYANA